MMPIRSRRRVRALRDDERRLWEKVTETVEPLDGERRPPTAEATSETDPPTPPADRTVSPAEPAAAVEEAGETKPRRRRIVRPTGPTRIDTARAIAAIHVKHRPTEEGLPPAVEAPPSLATIDERTRRRLARGSLPIDGRLDLHGMTQEAAHSALRHFLRSSRTDGARIVLVITGKGRSGGDGPWDRGVLRRAVPHWLAAADLRDCVIGFEEAHVAHGGAGAIYVRIRRAGRGRS
jgi:DNA-nicking Smr family endonuclease